MILRWSFGGRSPDRFFCPKEEVFTIILCGWQGKNNCWLKIINFCPFSNRPTFGEGYNGIPLYSCWFQLHSNKKRSNLSFCLNWESYCLQHLVRPKIKSIKIYVCLIIFLERQSKAVVIKSTHAVNVIDFIKTRV